MPVILVRLTDSARDELDNQLGEAISLHLKLNDDEERERERNPAK